MKVRPFVKSLGGKTALLPEILPRLPKKIRVYREPFVGGGAVFFALASEEKRRYESAVLSDANPHLINVYKQIRDDANDLIAVLSKLKHSEKEFYKQREIFNGFADGLSQAARYLYLNRTCFNGLVRFNKKGEFNAPFGHYKNPKICDEENLRAVSAALQGVLIKWSSALDEMAGYQKGDAVYADPPYLPKPKGKEFTAYTADGFGLAEHEQLAKMFGKLKGFALLSNSDTPKVRELYKRWQVDTVYMRRSINSNGAGRGKVREVLVTKRRAKR